MTMIQTIQKISGYSKPYSLIGAEVAGAVGLSSKLLYGICKEGGLKNMTKNLSSLGGYGFLIGASIFTGAFIADDIIKKLKK